MKHIFSTDGALLRFLRRLMELVLLNLLFLLCCLPVFTIGASLAALYGVTLRPPKSGLCREFFRIFRRDFRQATAVFLLTAFCGGVIFLDYCLSRSQPGQAFTVFSAVLLLFGFVLLMAAAWLFPMVSLLENSVKGYYLDAFQLSIRHLPWSIWMAVLNAAPFVVLLYFPYWFFKFGYLFLLIAFSLTARLHRPILCRVFRAWLPEETAEPEATEAAQEQEAAAFFSKFSETASNRGEQHGA